MKIIHTDDAPAPVAHYSPAIVHGGVVWCAGQVAIDPKTGEMVRDSVRGETRQVLRNLRAVLEAAGSSMSRALKVTVYLAEITDGAAMNEEFAAAFGDHKPARVTIAVKGLPLGARVEIDCIAALND
ncbi:MAG: hypothetical protein H6739_35610 [Alphaproteobacteria bacterium]|nr:hypothetical protein [Alphaproteobacteria bacterium]